MLQANAPQQPARAVAQAAAPGAGTAFKRPLFMAWGRCTSTARSLLTAAAPITTASAPACGCISWRWQRCCRSCCRGCRVSWLILVNAIVNANRCRCAVSACRAVCCRRAASFPGLKQVCDNRMHAVSKKGLQPVRMTPHVPCTNCAGRIKKLFLLVQSSPQEPCNSTTLRSRTLTATSSGSWAEKC